MPNNETVDAEPVKSFFVSMLTRDISLADSILDLLDNCVDGVLRSKKRKTKKKPYKGFHAHITFNKNKFSISDNCGGIPWSLKDYAFRMGRSSERPKEVDGSVGVYGIGMKRAMFKIGEQCLLETQNSKEHYQVAITPQWLRSDSWKLPVKMIPKNDEPDGTKISITKLNKGVSNQFSNVQAFEKEMHGLVSTHYAFIIDKGFEVKINDTVVKAKPSRLVFDRSKNSHIRPYIYEAVIDDVEVFLAVGFTRPIPTKDEVEDEQVEPQYSSREAGWTILCNDRAVLYCNRDELTGWGEAGIARYHTQFISISGIVEFRSKDPRKLPTTTTKRGIDASSPLYLQVKNRMREGMGIFINYTNKWKGMAEESKGHMSGATPLTLPEIKLVSKELKMSKPRNDPNKGSYYKPTLPMPKKAVSNSRRITFTKDIGDIKSIAEYFLDDPDANASEVGEYCFDLCLEDTK